MGGFFHAGGIPEEQRQTGCTDRRRGVERDEPHKPTLDQSILCCQLSNKSDNTRGNPQVVAPSPAAEHQPLGKSSKQTSDHTDDQRV
jgi:hypothetical protein